MQASFSGSRSTAASSENAKDTGDATAPNQGDPSVEREAKVMRYKEKKKKRRYDKHIRYALRQAYAEMRPRINGRFAKAPEMSPELSRHRHRHSRRLNYNPLHYPFCTVSTTEPGIPISLSPSPSLENLHLQPIEDHIQHLYRTILEYGGFQFRLEDFKAVLDQIFLTMKDS